MKKYDYYIGIDPDCENSGIGLVDWSDRRVLLATTKDFSNLIDYIIDVNQMYKNDNKKLLVAVEASWKVQSNWHLKYSDTKALAAAKGNSVGRNHETGRKIVEYLRHKGVEVLEIIPLTKCWKGKEKKITQAEISQFATGFPSRSNQEARDAALIAWVTAELPILITTKRPK